MKFRYFITDNSHVGTLIIGKLNPRTMLLLLGMKSSINTDKLDIVNFFIREFQFIIETENIEFIQLNTDDRFPYTYYNLIDEHAADKDGYFYANISDIKNHFENNGCSDMLKSIDWINFKKSNFSFCKN